MTNVVALATKSNNNKTISPKQLLEEMLSDLEKGTFAPEKLLAIYYEPQTDGTFNVGYYASNLDRFEHMGLLELNKSQVITDWQT